MTALGSLPLLEVTWSDCGLSPPIGPLTSGICRVSFRPKAAVAAPSVLNTPHSHLEVLSTLTLMSVLAVAYQKYKFKQAERHAVYIVHKEKCYICGNALTMRTCQVDHVIPESIADNAAALEEACTQLGRPSGFEVNSYENWLPVCGPCNVEKLAKVWDPSLQVQNALQQAADRAEKARNIESELTNDRKLTNALSIVLAAAEDDAFTAEMIESLMPLLAFQTQHREQELEGAPIRFAPFLEVDSYRFDTTANLAKIPGSDDEMIDMGNEFFVQGARLTDFMVRVSWKPPTTGGRARYLHMDVYKEQPKYEGPHRGSLGDGSPLIILTTGKTGMCEIDGYQVSIQSWQQDASALWIVLSTSGPSIYT